MKTRLIVCALMAAFALGGHSFAQSQADATEKANVPFDFYAGDQKLPAGTYSIGIDLEDKTISLTDESGNKRMFLMGTPDGDGDERSELVFAHSGNTYELEEVRSDVIDLHFATKVPEEVATVNSHPEVEVALNR